MRVFPHVLTTTDGVMLNRSMTTTRLRLTTALLIRPRFSIIILRLVARSASTVVNVVQIGSKTRDSSLTNDDSSFVRT